MQYDEKKIGHITTLLRDLHDTRRSRDALMKVTKSKRGCVHFVLSKYERNNESYSYTEGDDGKQTLYRANSENVAHLLMPIFQGRIRDIEVELTSLNVALPAETVSA